MSPLRQGRGGPAVAEKLRQRVLDSVTADHGSVDLQEAQRLESTKSFFLRRAQCRRAVAQSGMRRIPQEVREGSLNDGLVGGGSDSMGRG
jgi:hypothetical protein